MKKLLIILFIPSVCLAQLIDTDVMPFGCYASELVHNTTLFSDSCLAVMHDSLGINQFVGGNFTPYHAGRFANNSIFPYPAGVDSTWSVKAHRKYGFATYFRREAEDDISDFIFEVSNGSAVTVNDTTYLKWTPSNDSTMLDSLFFRQYNRHYWISEDDPLTYYPHLRIGLDTLRTDTNTVVGIFYVIRQSDSNMRFVDTVFVRDLPQDTVLHTTELSLVNDLDTSITHGLGFYRIFDDADSTNSKKMQFRFIAKIDCPIYIDYFLLHCQFGDLLMAGDYNNLIYQSAGDPDFDSKILGWYITDEPFPGNYTPYRYIDSLIQVVMVDSGWADPVRAAGVFCQVCGGNDWKGLKDFVNIAQPEVLWSDIYPFRGGQGGWRTTYYTGYFYSESPPERGLQAELQKTSAYMCSTSMDAAIAGCDSAWMLVPQYFAGRKNDPSDTAWIWRLPTRTEMSCETFIAMCYHPKAIMFWKYDNSQTSYTYIGLVEEDGDHHEWMYDAVKEDINPYIKAIDSTYLSLTWVRAYAVSDSAGLGYQPPPGSWIDTVYAISNSPDSNPDLGWFHVGQFTDTSSAKYVMIVNRACSQGLENPEPAPSITATVKFNPTNLGLEDYVYVIDLATGTCDTNWVGIPDTTYSALMPDTTIPFTTILGPGEGRLFKLVQGR
jgi:hypothetical protein